MPWSKKIHPTAIVVCGKCPEWIAKKFPDIKIIPIKNHVQQWHEREKRNSTGGGMLHGGYGGERVVKLSENKTVAITTAVKKR